MSSNELLGSGLSREISISNHKEIEHKRTPTFRYHKDCIHGKLVKYDEELEVLEKQGWVDHPGKACRLPGHEKIYDEFQEKQNKRLIITEIPVKVTEVKAEIQIYKSPDSIKADKLKADSDLIEKERLEKELKSNLVFGDGLNPGPPCTCLICGKVFESLKQLNMHGIGAHRNKEDLTPDEIKIKEEEEKEEKEQKEEMVIAVSVYKCEICNKEFNKLYKYTAHNRKTHGFSGLNIMKKGEILTLGGNSANLPGGSGNTFFDELPKKEIIYHDHILSSVCPEIPTGKTK